MAKAECPSFVREIGVDITSKEEEETSTIGENYLYEKFMRILADEETE